MAIISCLLLGIGEDLVGGLDDLKFVIDFGFLSRVSIRMVFQSWSTGISGERQGTGLVWTNMYLVSEIAS